MPNLLRAKCVLIGEQAVGKTSICQVFLNDNSQFPKSYNMTLGLEIHTKILNIPELHYAMQFVIIDTGGHEMFLESISKNLDKVIMVILVYDVTNYNSFKACQRWIERITNKGQFIGVLVANKIDLEERRVVSSEAGKNLAESLQLQYIECSTKKLENVEAIFKYLANSFCKSHIDSNE